MRWFVNKNGEIFFISFDMTDSNANDLERQLNELIAGISHSLQSVRCEHRSLDACYEISLLTAANHSKELNDPV